MNLEQFQVIEKVLCERINGGEDLLKASVSDYQYKKYLEFRKGYLTALIDMRRIFEKESVVSK